MIALLDGDVIVYACGFASEEKYYELSVNGETKEFRYKKELDDYIGEFVSPDAYISVETVVKVPPLSHSIHNVNMLLDKVLTRVSAKDYKIYLTGKNNFREQVATIRGYKAHRDKLAKPAHYNEIKQYLIDRFGAEVVDGMEADDAMAIKQMEHYTNLDDYTVICSIDKDLDQVPGWHYNWNRDELYKITEEYALRYYAKQMLIGDATDNILGIPGMGPKKADKLIAEVAVDDLQAVLLNAYKKAFSNKEIYAKYNIPEHLSWEDIYNETDKLIRIKWTLDD